MTSPLCGAAHHLYPDTLCTQPAGHYRRDRDPHGGPLIIDGRECGSAAWDEPQEQQMTERIPLDDLTSDQLAALYAEQDRYEEVVGELNEANTGLARRAAQAEAALARVHHLADLIHAGAPWTACHTELATRIRAAITGPTTTEK